MALGEWTRKCQILWILAFLPCLVAGDESIPVPVVQGFRIESSELTEGVVDGVSVLYYDQLAVIRLYGTGLTSRTQVTFTTKNSTKGSNCDDLKKDTDPFLVSEIFEYSAVVSVKLPPLLEGEEKFYICAKQKYEYDDTANITDTDTSGSSWVHQGDEPYLSLITKKDPSGETIFPMWLQIILIVVLLCCSGTFSGLNLGLMSLDKTELKIIENSGTEQEKKYARIVGTVRKRGNYLLCTILLGNVLVNNTLAILMDDLTGSGAVAILSATAGIVVFGEIVPQAVCSRYGLAIGARTIWFTRFFMLLTFPASFPISKILDCVLGEEMGIVYKRDRLRELLRVTQGDIDLKKDEVNIIDGALQLSKKTVADIMTKLDDVYMIDHNAVLDFETMSEIMKTGYTRVPVYEKDKSNIIALLNIKDLAFVDPDDRTPLKTVCKFYNHPINFVWEDTKLDSMLEDFKKGQCHLSFVRRVNNEGTGDPYYETLGLVTLEDVIEEIIQSEIIDETDTVVDNRSRTTRKTAQHRDFSAFKPSEEDETYPRMSPQLTLATFQYLSTTVPPFKAELISETVLQRLLKQNVVENFNLKDTNSSDCLIYTSGKAADYFVLILEGRVEVDVGKEHMIFEGGPFMYFGVQGLTGMISSLSKQQSVTSISSASDSVYAKQPQYVPDFSVKALTNVTYLKIRRSHYIAARRATLMERQPQTPDMDNTTNPGEDAFAKEWKRAISINAHQHDSDSVTHSKDSRSPSTVDGDIVISGSNTPRNLRSRSGTAGSLGGGNEPTAGSPLLSHKPNGSPKL